MTTCAKIFSFIVHYINMHKYSTFHEYVLDNYFHLEQGFMCTTEDRVSVLKHKGSYGKVNANLVTSIGPATHPFRILMEK